MTIHEFLELDAETQLEIWFEGTLIGEFSIWPTYTVVCKKVFDFYVEYLKKDKIWIDLRCFEDPALCVRYLDSSINNGLVGYQYLSLN